MDRIKMERYQVARTVQDTLSRDFLKVEEVADLLNDLTRLGEAGVGLSRALQRTLETELTLDEVTSRPKLEKILHEYQEATK